MKKLLSTVALLLATAGMAQAAGELQLYNWGDYTNPELLKKFEAETGIKVTVTDYDSNDTALAKVHEQHRVARQLKHAAAQNALQLEALQTLHAAQMRDLARARCDAAEAAEHTADAAAALQRPIRHPLCPLACAVVIRAAPPCFMEPVGSHHAG